jgi:hypothetical protein
VTVVDLLLDLTEDLFLARFLVRIASHGCAPEQRRNEDQ